VEVVVVVGLRRRPRGVGVVVGGHVIVGGDVVVDVGVAAGPRRVRGEAACPR
jgi:hypothetical protein